MGGELVGLTFGGPDARTGLKDALSRGVDRAVHVVADEGTRADGHVTAHVLAAQVRRLDDVDLVVCTEGASDTYAHETGPRLGELLGWPVVTNVRELTVEGRTLRAVRVVGVDLETVEADLPALVTVVPEVAPAPIPGLRSVLGAAKKPSEQVPVADLGLPAAAVTARTTVTSFLGYVAVGQHHAAAHRTRSTRSSRASRRTGCSDDRDLCLLRGPAARRRARDDRRGARGRGVRRVPRCRRGPHARRDGRHVGRRARGCRTWHGRCPPTRGVRGGARRSRARPGRRPADRRCDRQRLGDRGTCRGAPR